MLVEESKLWLWRKFANFISCLFLCLHYSKRIYVLKYTVPRSDSSLGSILSQHIIIPEVKVLFVEFRSFSSHFRTFIDEFCRDRRLRAFSKISKILVINLFSFPWMSQILSTTPGMASPRSDILRNQDCIKGVEFGLKCKEIFGLLVTVDLVPSPKCASWSQITKLLASLLITQFIISDWLTLSSLLTKQSLQLIVYLVGNVVPLSNFRFPPDLTKPC